MQLAAAIALTVFYVSLTLAWGGVPPDNGTPWWVLAPFIVTFGAGLLHWMISAVIPAPWAEGRRYSFRPRRVHVSWRTAFLIPGHFPILVLLYYFYWALSLHFDIAWVLYLVAALTAMLVSFVTQKRRREFRLLRDGEMTMGVVDARDPDDGVDSIAYHFTTAHGTTVAGRGWDLGYTVLEGSYVPVFYDTGDPANHVVACACWFEAD